MKKSVYTLSVILAGSFWGFMGLFRRHMGDMGFDSFGVILIRCSVAALCFGLTIIFRDVSQFKIKLRDLWCFLGSGFCSLLFFSVCYFQAMQLMSLSAAAILLYTSPCFVLVMSAVIFKDKLTRRKLFAMLLAVCGCAFVSGIIGSDSSLGLVGILYGLGGGLGYALYSIFGKLAMQRGYKSSTINFYSCGFAALGAGLIWGFKAPFDIMLSSAGNLGFCVLAGVLSCFVPYLLYTFGLSGIDAGKASIVASIEPVVATFVGIVFFGESLTLFTLLGIVLVLSAIVLTETGSKHRHQLSPARFRHARRIYMHARPHGAH